MEPQIEANVTRVIDGDTIEVVITGGLLERVRLIGVDTPEIFSKNQQGEFGTIKDGDCLDLWGAKAKDLAIEMLSGKTVLLALDQAEQRDAFGRLLAYVVIDGTDFSSLLVKQGYGRVRG